MYKEKTILALIPARGGSKGLPRKNIRPLLGKPLIAWTIEQAKASKYIDRVVVSTDDEEIAEVAKKYGAEVPFMRPKELARDDSPTIDAVLHALEFFSEKGEKFDLLALLEPTSPLRKRGDIDRGIEILINSKRKATAVVSVGKVTLEHPAIMKKIDSEGFLIPFIEAKGIYQRQQLEDVYFPYGVLYLSFTEAVRKYRTFYQPKTLPLFIERWQNYEIDDYYDLLCTEAILREKISEVL